LSFDPLFRTHEGVYTDRLRLRAARTPDVEAMPWLAAAVSPEWSLDDLLAHVEADEAIAMEKEGRAVGIAVALPDAPAAGLAAVPLVAIDPAERFRGLGGEAALAVERRISERWGARRVLAAIPEGRGLAVYFWLRLGYAPLTSTRAPWPLSGLNGKPVPGIWMARDLG
jgi:GNAT superfamily N-acetyltransferase